MQFICYERCTTCKRAKSFLDANGVQYDFRDIKSENPSYEELKKWHESSGLDIKKFFNTSGLLYKSLELKDKLKDMSLEDKLRLLSTDGMLVKRPILVGDNFVLVGYKEQEWKDKI